MICHLTILTKNFTIYHGPLFILYFKSYLSLLKSFKWFKDWEKDSLKTNLALKIAFIYLQWIVSHRKYSFVKLLEIEKQNLNTGDFF